MRCIREAELVKAELGELTLNQAHTVDAHVAACSRCTDARAAIRELVADFGRLPAAPEGERFVARVMAARSTETARPRRRLHIPRFALAAVMVLAIGSAIVAASRWGTKETWLARGPRDRTSSRGPGPSCEVLVMRDGRLHALSGRTLSSTDSFAVRYVNPTRQTQYLAAFALDAAGAVHWIFPEYVDAATDPASIALAPSEQERLLPQVVAPDQPAQGPMRVFTLLTREPASVKPIESALRNAPAGVPAADALIRLYPGALIREWSCSWDVR